MNNMCIMLPKGGCPICGKSQFVVIENEYTLYLTGINGEVVDHGPSTYSANGKCINCKAEFEMKQTHLGFIPMTKLRKLLWDYNFKENKKEIKSISNPMGVKEDGQ